MTKEKLGCSQEMLKLIACITMLIDHIGAILFPENDIFRIIGRIAFPIYCFLLIEGAKHTSNQTKYGVRLFVSAIIAEIPYDLAIHNHITWEHQNIMWTLLLGYLMILICEQCSTFSQKIVAILPFTALAEFGCTDYGLIGILTIAVFYLSYNKSLIWTIVGLTSISILNTAQIFALLSVIPLMLYNKQKLTHDKIIQYGFYLFYPIHLFVLYIINQL